MSMNHSARELAEEARRALEAAPMTSDELFEFLVTHGIIDRSGRLLGQRLFGEMEPGQSETAAPPPLRKRRAARTEAVSPQGRRPPHRSAGARPFAPPLGICFCTPVRAAWNLAMSDRAVA